MANPFAPLPFAEAIAWARARQVVLPDVYYGELQGLARSMAFSIAGLAKLDQLQAVMDSLAAATANGESFGTWKQRATTQALDLPSHRIENIFRTNIQGHYGRGRCEQQARNVESRPWYLYDAVNDSRTRPSHAAMDGLVARYDDPIWDSWTPACGFRCRCRRISLSERQAERFRAADLKRLEDPEILSARMNARPDTGWDYNPCAEPDEGLRRAWEAKVGKVHPALARVAVEAMEQAPENPAPWTILEGDQATLGEIKRLGGERLDELLAMVTPNDRLRDEEKGRVLRDILDDTKIPSRDVAAWFREQVLTRAREVRAIGGVAPELLNKSGKGKDLMQRVASKLPDDWVEAGNAAGPLRVKVNENGRGYFNARKAVDVGKYERFIQTDTGSTAEHEFIHHLQYAMPRLDALFQEEHRRRTSSEPLEWLGGNYAKSEKGRKDGYVEMYQGKEYEPTATHGPALEVITMAYQALLGEDGQASLWLRDMLRKDRDMVSLAVGALFHFRP